MDLFTPPESEQPVTESNYFQEQRSFTKMPFKIITKNCRNEHYLHRLTEHVKKVHNENKRED